MLNNIYSQLRSEIQDYTNNYIEVVYGYNFLTYETIKRCHSYYNSQFQDKSKISGQEKIFFNISKVRAKVAAKLLKIKPDDLTVQATTPESGFAAFLLQHELKQWNIEHKVERMFNEIRRKLPIYGTTVIKKVKTKWDKGVIDLRRYAQDPTVDSVEESRFVTIKHYLTDSELRRMAKDNGWDKTAVDTLIRLDRTKNAEAPKSYPMRDTNVSNVIRSSVYHEVWERYGEVPEQWLKGEPQGYQEEETVRSLFFVANPFDIAKMDNGATVDNGVVLFKSKWLGSWPFKDAHYDKTEGRWLGVGVVEDLFPVQERRNEMANQKRIAMNLSSLHIFQTEDSTVVENVITDLQNGDVIRSGSKGGLTPLDNEERNLGAFQNEEGVYSTLANEVSFINAVLLGESTGGRQTATGNAIMNQNSVSEFDDKKDALALVLKEYYQEMILPEALKDINRAHILRFSGSLDELEFFDNEYAKKLADEKIVNGEVEVEGHDDYNLLVQTILSKLKKKGKERWLEIKDAMYKDAKYDLYFSTKDEDAKSLALLQQSFQFLSSVAQNPALLSNPMVRPIFMKINEMMGVNPMDIEYAESMANSANNGGQQGQLSQPTQPGERQPEIANNGVAMRPQPTLTPQALALMAGKGK